MYLVPRVFGFVCSIGHSSVCLSVRLIVRRSNHWHNTHDHSSIVVYSCIETCLSILHEELVMKVRTTTVTTTMMMIMTSRVSTCSYSERKRNTELLHRSLYTCSTLYTVFQYNTNNFPDDVTKLPCFVTSNFKFVYSSIAYRYISYWYFLNSLNVLNVLLSIKHMSDCTHVCLVKCIKATVYSCMIMNERLRTVMFWLVQNVCGYSLRTICTYRKVRVQNPVVVFLGTKHSEKTFCWEVRV